MKKRNYILIVAAVIFLAGLSVGTVIMPDSEFSANENRYLTQKPELNMDDILSGRFETQAEEYLSDQIAGRELWVKIKSMTEKSLGIADINGVYLCSDGRVVERHTEKDFSWGQYNRNIDETLRLEEACEAAGTYFHVMLVPTAAEIYEDVLPENALRFDEDRAFGIAERVFGEKLIDTREALVSARSEGDVFFRTDHHWTGRGAYAAYVRFAEAAQISGKETAMSYENLEKTVLTEDFKGTLYSKVLLENLGSDTIETLSSAADAGYKLFIEDREADSIFFMDKLEEKDKYAVFFGGNYAKTDLMLYGEGEKLLIVKDSFANSFVPYLLDDFSKITMVDTRFYRQNIAELAEDYDRVLVLYSVKNFADERLVLIESLLK